MAKKITIKDQPEEFKQRIKDMHEAIARQNDSRIPLTQRKGRAISRTARVTPKGRAAVDKWRKEQGN